MLKKVPISILTRRNIMRNKLYAIVFATCLLTQFAVSSGEKISNGPWIVSADKGELTAASIGGTSFLISLGGFQVVGKKEVRPFNKVSELRENKNGIMVFEGISDDGKHQFVEFGAVIKAKESLDFMLFLSWLPPGPRIPDAVEGVLRFASSVKSVKNTPLPPKETLIPGTLDYILTLDGGVKIRMRLRGVDKKKITIKKEKSGILRMTFEERRDYLRRDYKPNCTKRSKRLLSYWIRNIDTHFIQFTFSKI
jgi:hypothetical protein